MNEQVRRKPSDFINIKRLECENRKYLLAGFIYAISMFFAIAPFVTYRRYKPAPETYRRIKLFDIPARPPEPYMLERGRPLDRERWEYYLKKAETAFRFKKTWDDLQSIEELEERRFMAKVEHELEEEAKHLTDRNMLPDSLTVAERFVPDGIGYDTRISREHERSFSLREELLNLDDIDKLGKYKGFVIQDPSDKQNIRGFFYIPKRVAGFSAGFNLGDAVVGLAEAFNYYTGLDLKIDKPISFGSPEFLEYPVVYITTTSRYASELGSFQTKKFGEYLRNGGFAIIDNGTPWKDYTPAEASLMNLLYKALGEDFQLKRISRDHPVYHCFFDFDGLPPEGAENWTPPVREEHKYKSSLITHELPPNFFGRLSHVPELEKVRAKVSKFPHSLWGIWLGERLVAVYSDKGYGHLWRDGTTLYKHRDFSSSDGSRYNFNPQLKMGVNMMVFALIQQGGIAKRYVDYQEKSKKL